MAENKNKVIIYRDWVSTFESLQDDEAGRLIKHLFRYINDLNPEPPDRLTMLLFEPIKQTLKRDLQKYISTCQKNKENVGTRWNKEDTTVCDRKEPNTNHTDSDSDSDIDSDNDKKIKSWRDDFDIYLIECKKVYNQVYNDQAIIKEQEVFNPGVNIKKSIAKGFTNYWGTMAGWKKKKASRTKDIDWKSTIINSITLNKVYYSKDELQKMQA